MLEFVVGRSALVDRWDLVSLPAAFLLQAI
jgi:hypothetical protein